jgi:DNA-binding CsgD family transcriptional regulator
MTPWQRMQAAIKRALQYLVFARRIFELDEEARQSIRLLSMRQEQPEGEVAAELVYFALAHRERAEANLRRWESLSPREKQVTALVCLNLSNQQIAERLVVSPETVKTHVRNTLYKFNLRSKNELRLLLADWDFSAWAEADLREY